ncbi:hypothetical protein CYMTET_45193 [Cymbomonas tetramitiformis]|uniref:Uncharacterized protein n=1 Tax=Cymbomonas tetramitiformis TaxID=36881 RepID=A0AAE0EYJ5_9CHLO|nr:hypothetical protein CYMTET_45193 [Cymbomonas tetramitiformis]
MWSPQLDRMRVLENEIIQRVLTQARVNISSATEKLPSNPSFTQLQTKIKETQLKNSKSYVLWSFVVLVLVALIFVRNNNHSEDNSLQANPDDDDANAKMNDVVNQFRLARKAKAAAAISEAPAASMRKATKVAPRVEPMLTHTPWFQPAAAAIDLNLPALKDRKAVVVGNGASIRGSRMGSVIDSYKNVIRFNLFKTKGYEIDVGRKTNTWVLSSIKDPNDMDPSEVQGLRQALVNLPDDSKEWKIKDSKRRLDNCKTLPATTKTWAGVFKKETDVLRKDYGLKEKFLSSGVQVAGDNNSRKRGKPAVLSGTHITHTAWRGDLDLAVPSDPPYAQGVWRRLASRQHLRVTAAGAAPRVARREGMRTVRNTMEATDPALIIQVHAMRSLFTPSDYAPVPPPQSAGTHPGELH